MSIDKLKDYGLEEMSGEEISDFLESQGVGVLGLPTGNAPYLIPMSFGYDGGSRLYFTYFAGDTSRKIELTRKAETAGFLVYSAESVFSWESVYLTGRITQVSMEEWGEHGDALENSWHLDLFQKAETSGELKLYEFRVLDSTGVRHPGLPPGLEPE